MYIDNIKEFERAYHVSDTIPDWMRELSEEDWQFIKRLLLASGSLKDVARQYQITYPTVRIRLNRLIEKVQVLDSQQLKTKFHQKIQLLVVEGKLDTATARMLLKTHEESMSQKNL